MISFSRVERLFSRDAKDSTFTSQHELYNILSSVANGGKANLSKANPLLLKAVAKNAVEGYESLPRYNNCKVYQNQCDQKNSPNVYNSCPKMISLEKWDFDTYTKLPKNVGDLGKSIAAKGLKKLPKVQ